MKDEDIDQDEAALIQRRWKEEGSRSLDWRKQREALHAALAERDRPDLSDRTEQLNLKFTPAFVNLVRASAKARGIKLRDYMELAVFELEKRR